MKVPGACSLLCVIVLHMGAAACGHAQDRGLSGQVMFMACQRLCCDYVHPNQLRPQAMVTGGLAAIRAIEPRVAAITVGDRLEVVLDQGQRVLLSCRMPRTLWDAAEVGDHVVEALSACRVESGHGCDLKREFMNGMLASLDPYTTILPPAEARALDEHVAGTRAGIGASLEAHDGRYIFDTVRRGLPAEKAGLREGDRLMKIGGKPVGGSSLDELVASIVGPVGTPIRLTVERQAQSIELTATRAEIPVITMKACRCGDTGCVRMDGFNERAEADLRQAIADLQASRPLTGFVLDLRCNGGGIVDQARAISSLFLPRGSEVLRLARSSGRPAAIVTDREPILQVPMIVLVSEHTASAAEILAGTLQCHDRAVIVGKTTFGKGLVQAVCDLPDGGELKYSIAEYRLPGDVVVQGLGIMPDVSVSDGTEGTTAGISPAVGASRHRFLEQSAILLRVQRGLDPHRDDDLGDPRFAPDAQAHLVITMLSRVTDPAHSVDCASAGRRGILLERLQAVEHESDGALAVTDVTVHPCRSTSDSSDMGR